MASILYRRPNWFLRWYDKRDRDSLGRPRRHWLQLGPITREAARAAKRAKERELAAGVSRGVAPKLLLNEWAHQYLSWHAAEFPDSHFRVEQIARMYLLPQLGHLPLDVMPASAVEGYKAQRRAAGAKAGTIAKEMRTLHAIINRAVVTRVIHQNSIQSVKAPRVLDKKAPRFYSAEELRGLYVVCVSPWSAPVWRLLANTGMRRGEALNMRWSWVKADSLSIQSTGEERTKSGEWREIPLSAGAKQALSELRTLQIEGEYVLPPITAPSLSRSFIKAAKRAGIGGSMHCLRHTYISHLVTAGVPLRVVQIYAGHSTMRVTEQYAHLAPGYGHEIARDLAL